ncbi:metabotropic glutamate receptor [Nephila pilipes]|uniref:Metabotropic glutamate receptor n=1 Tax=Nephila pilipes TaxID=299642 RepID=A0A8X6NGJ2_NEPPI|nr:metabotropic glutamate receptor [Nephila pilipes]
MDKKAFDVLEELFQARGICIAIKEKLIKDSGIAADDRYDNIVQKMLSKPTAKGVIVFGSDQEVACVMRAVRRNNASGVFSWIGSDGWSARALVFEGYEKEVEGTLSVQPRSFPVPGFEEYFLNLSVSNNPRNPWFTEYWEHSFNCKYPNSTRTPYNEGLNPCTGNEKLSEKTGYETEKQLEFVSNAVLAFAFALKTMHQDICNSKHGLCSEMNPVDGAVLLSYLKNVTFKGLGGEHFEFSRNGDGPARYNVIHFKQVSPGYYKWICVGIYLNGKLHVDLSELQFHLELPKMPSSVCSIPCDIGEIKNFLEEKNCCWHCLRCSKYEVTVSETQCVKCPLGWIPNKTQTKCVEVSIWYLNFLNGWTISAILISSLGIVITLYIVGVFIKFRETPIIKASGRELSFVILIGILMCFCMTFVLMLKPTDMICKVQPMGISSSFTIIYGALLTKTIRILRIFKAGAGSFKCPPKYISPKSQILICIGIICIQMAFSITWIIISSPKAVLSHDDEEELYLSCVASLNGIHVISFTFPIILIISCTVSTFLARTIPKTFSEAKYIGFTMYSTSIIWFAFIPIYFSTYFQTKTNVSLMAVTVSLSAFVALVCLFSRKTYIIIFHSEKNIRKPLMKQKKYGIEAASSNFRNMNTVSEDSAETSDPHRSTMIYDKTYGRNSGTQTPFVTPV